MSEPDRLPPFDGEAEAGALGCVLQNPDCLDQLTWQHFYDERHQVIFDAIKTLDSRGFTVDTVSLDQYLKSCDLLGKAGGKDYVGALPDKTPSPKNFPSWLATLEDFAARRRMVQDAAELSRKAYDTRTPVAPPKGDLPPLLDASDFIAQPVNEPAQLVHGVLHRGSKLVLGGGSKSFKTWTLLDLALSVAHGAPWLSFDTTAGRVLYVNFEIQAWSWQARIRKVAEAKGIEIQPGKVSLWNLRGKAADFATLLPKIAAQASDYALIILDPIYKLYGQTDENRAGDVARLLNAIEDLAVSTGAAVAFGAHFSKGNQAGKESIDRISGSGVFARDPDSLLVFTKHEDEDCFTVEATLRNFPPPDPFVVRWQYPLMTVDPELDPSRLKQTGGKPREYDERKLLAAIKDRTDGNPVSMSEWSRLADIHRNTLGDYAAGFRTRGLLGTIGEGSKARKFITQKGKEWLNAA